MVVRVSVSRFVVVLQKFEGFALTVGRLKCGLNLSVLGYGNLALRLQEFLELGFEILLLQFVL